MINIRIKTERENMDLTQKELADRLDISAGAVGMYEQGRRTPEIYIIEKMANLFNCSVDYLLGRTNDRNYTIKDPTENEAIVILANTAKLDKEKIKEFVDYLKYRHQKED